MNTATETAEDRIRRMTAERLGRTMEFRQGRDDQGGPPRTMEFRNGRDALGAGGVVNVGRPGVTMSPPAGPPRVMDPVNPGHMDVPVAARPQGGVSRTAPPRPAAPQRTVKFDLNAPDALAPAGLAQVPQYRTISSPSGKHSIKGRIEGYDNDASVVKITTEDGRTIIMPSSELDDASTRAAYEAPAYVASDADRGAAAAKRERMEQYRKSVAASQPPARPKATTQAPKFDRSAPDTLGPTALTTPRKPAPQPRPAGGSLDKSDGGWAEVAAADPARPAREGYQRFRTFDGKYTFDGQVVAHDPKAGIVRIQTPDGGSHRMYVDDLDDQSQGQYKSRVAEHAEKTQHEANRVAYEKTHGPGSFDMRHGAVVHNNGRSTLIPPGAVFPQRAQAAAAPADAPIADVPKAAAKVAAAAVANPQQDPRGELQEKFDRDRGVRNNDRQTRLASGQGHSNVEQQGALEDVDALRGIADRQDAAEAARVAQFQQDNAGRRQDDMAATAKERARREGLSPEERAGEDNLRLFRQAARAHHNNRRHFQQAGMTLDQHAEELGVDMDHIQTAHPQAYRDAHIASSAAADRHGQQTAAANANRWNRMSPAAQQDAARRQLSDPSISLDQRASAWHILGRPDMARQIVEADAVVRAETAKANAASATERTAIHMAAGKGGGKPGSDPMNTARQAIEAAGPNASHAAQHHAAAAAIARELGGADPAAYRDQADQAVEENAWQRLMTGARPSPADHAYFYHGIIGGEVEWQKARAADPKAPRPKPLGEDEFVKRAMLNHMPQDQAREYFRRFMGTPVGAPDRPGI